MPWRSLLYEDILIMSGKIMPWLERLLMSVPPQEVSCYDHYSLQEINIRPT